MSNKTVIFIQHILFNIQKNHLFFKIIDEKHYKGPMQLN